MRSAGLVAAFLIGVSAGTAQAQGAPALGGDLGWSRYVEPRLGTRVDMPTGLFPAPAGAPGRGVGERFATADRRAQMTVYSIRNEAGDTPASFVRKNLRRNRGALDYDRVTDRFFAISAVAGARIFYTRCNFDHGRATIHCVDLAYPRREEKAWDRIVTRISLSLRPL
jgi:hypothetical protein